MASPPLGKLTSFTLNRTRTGFNEGLMYGWYPVGRRVITGIAATAAAPAWACPACAAGRSTGWTSTIGLGVMMVIPFALALGVYLTVTRTARRERRKDGV